MATVTRIFETPNVAQFSLVGKIGDELVANRLENGNTVVLISQDSARVPYVSPKGQVFTAGAVGNGKIFGSVLAPRKPQFGQSVDTDGNVAKFDPVDVKNAAVLPFWSDDLYVLATVADRTTTKRTAVYTANGTLFATNNAQMVGRNANGFVYYEKNFVCPDGFSLPVATRASGDVTIGLMYLSDKRSGVTACSWAEVNGRHIWIVPNGALGCDRFAAKSFTSDGTWVFGLAYPSNGESPFQVNAAFNTVNGTWHSFVDLFSLDLSFADLVIDGNVVYGRASDGIYKVEGWK